MLTHSETATADPPVPPSLQIRLLGPFSVRVQHRPLPPLRTRKHAWLLALLILRYNRPVDRLWLASTLWPDSEEAEARKNLRNTLYELRRALGDQAVRLQSPTGVTLSLDLSGVEVDLLAFDAALTKGDSPELMVRLYGGPLLEGCTEEWVFVERERREQEYLEALESLAKAEVQSGRVGRAVQHLRICVGVDPLREGAQRTLMSALAESGGFAGSTEVYRAFRLLLHEELQTTPASETTALYERIRVRARQKAAVANVSQDSTAATRSSDPLPIEPHVPIHNLPAQRTSFVGRQQQIAQVKVLLSNARLLTLTGSGGCGKTRLSLRAASEMTDTYPDGVWLVELASLAEPTLVPHAVALVLGLNEGRDGSIIQTLTDNLRTRNLLLVLDNCEHLVSACAALASALLDACPGVKLLSTSRERLGVAGEQIYRVPSLSFPDTGQIPTVQSANQYESVRLLVERARLIDADFALTPENIPVIAQICRRLDGIPLGIELAAARVNSLSLDEIQTRLDQRFHLLRGSDRAALPRHQTLRALIDWSYDLLQAQEKLLLQRLSVFAGGWTLVAAEQVGAGESADGGTIEAWEVLDLMTSLVDKSLVLAETHGEASRYRLLETVRQYAWDKLDESGESEALRERHLDYFLEFAEEAEPKLTGSEQIEWLNRLEIEHDNLRSALEWAMDAGEAESGRVREGETVPSERQTANAEHYALRLAGSLWRFWEVRGYITEGRQRLASALARDVNQRDKPRKKALTGAGALAHSQGDYLAASMLFEESLTIMRELGDKSGIASSLGNLGAVAHGQGDFAAARTLCEESLTIMRELGNNRGTSAALNNLGTIANDQGDFAAARALHEESLTISRELEDKRGISVSLDNLGEVAYNRGDFARARELYMENLAICLELGNRHGVVWPLEAFASFAFKGNRAETSAILWGAAEVLREQIGRPLPPNRSEQYDRNVAEVKQALGDGAFEAAWEKGRAMTMQEAIAIAMEEASP